MCITRTKTLLHYRYRKGLVSARSCSITINKTFKKKKKKKAYEGQKSISTLNAHDLECRQALRSNCSAAVRIVAPPKTDKVLTDCCCNQGVPYCSLPGKNRDDSERILMHYIGTSHRAERSGHAYYMIPQCDIIHPNVLMRENLQIPAPSCLFGPSYAYIHQH